MEFGMTACNPSEMAEGRTRVPIKLCYNQIFVGGWLLYAEVKSWS